MLGYIIGLFIVTGTSRVTTVRSPVAVGLGVSTTPRLYCDLGSFLLGYPSHNCDDKLRGGRLYIVCRTLPVAHKLAPVQSRAESAESAASAESVESAEKVRERASFLHTVPYRTVPYASILAGFFTGHFLTP